MRITLRSMFTALFLVATTALPGLSEEPTPILEEHSEEPAPTKASGASSANAINGIIETVVYCEDFENGDGGWTAFDRDAGIRTEETFWHLDAGDWLCATEDPCWVNPGPGYGNHWDQRLSKSYLLPGGSVVMDLHHTYETEAFFDFCYVEVLPDGGSEFEQVAQFHGNSGGPVLSSIDLSLYAGTTVTIRLRFDSDGLGSDHYGLFGVNSDGAWRIDMLQVTGHALEDFASDQGWTPSAAPLGPPLASFRLESDPPCHPPAQYLIDEHGITSLNCVQPGPCAGPGNTAWVAYDPTTGLIPDIPAGYERRMNPGIESPSIPIPVPVGTSEYRLEFDVYGDQLFQRWLGAPPTPAERARWSGIVRQHSYAFPDPSDPCPIAECAPFCNFGWERAFLWNSDPAVGWRTVNQEFTPTGDEMLIRFTMGDWSNLTTQIAGTNRGRGPYFDNVRVVHLTAAPGPPVLECIPWFARAQTTCVVPALDIGPRLDFFVTRVLDDTTPFEDLIFTQDPPAGTPMSSGDAMTITVTDKDGNSASCDIIAYADPFTPGLGGGVVEAIGNLIDLVPASLNGYNGVVQKLEEAIDQFENGKPHVAVNKLRNFIDQVSGKVKNGMLSSFIGDTLIAETECLIELIESGAAKSGDVATDEVKAPAAFVVDQNIPNPFNPQTTIGFSLPTAGPYRLSIYNVTGKLVRTFTGSAETTSVSLVWDGTDDSGVRLGSGMYFYKVRAGSLSETKSMVLLK